MERQVIFDKFNTWYDWSLVLTSKSVPDPEIKDHYVELDGMSGTLDLTETLTGEVTYKDRPVTMSFWTNKGNRTDRAKLLREIRTALHGKKVKIIDPDDLDHYFSGRIKIKSFTNNLAYLEFTIEATCDPWRYYNEESTRYVEASETPVDVVIINNGTKTLCPDIRVVGSVNITYNDASITIKTGNVKIPELKLRQGVNVIGVSGNGSVTFTYREAEI